MTKRMLKLYNTESRQLEEIVPLDGRVVRMYTCGPTVYNFAHIGNFRCYVMEDLLRRSLKFLGYEVRQVMNLTDVDDKTIKGALEQKISLKEFTQPYIDAFFEDLATLQIEKAEHYPAATDYFPEMIALIEGLLAKGIAYRAEDGSIYFAIDQFPSYGRLSHLHLNELQVNASEANAADEYDKENVNDFVLWKAYDPERDGNIFWESPFGKGRPGWHIECSAMAMKLLGESIDIHAGGVDNMFPHHENEIAQSEAYSCRHFVKHWLHVEHLLVNHKKMSKSLGNFFTLRDLLAKGYTGQEVRYMLLQAHYRTQLNFTLEGLDGAVSTLRRLRDFIQRLQAIKKEKLVKALDVILDQALPPHPEKKKIQERILFEVRQESEPDILDPLLLRPILNRSLSGWQEPHAISEVVIEAVEAQGPKGSLQPILKKHLSANPHAVESILSLVHTVRDRDILNPEVLKPLLQKTLKAEKGSAEAVDAILSSLHEKKSHGLVYPLLQRTLDSFYTHLGADLNLSAALASLFDMVREINTLCDGEKVGIQDAEAVLDCLEKIDTVLGVLPLQSEEEAVPDELLLALERREKARAEKNWKTADACRDQIQQAGYLIEDTPGGARLKKMRKP